MEITRPAEEEKWELVGGLMDGKWEKGNDAKEIEERHKAKARLPFSHFLEIGRAARPWCVVLR